MNNDSTSSSSSFDPREQRVVLVGVSVDEGEADESRVGVRLRAGTSTTRVQRTGTSDMGGLMRTAVEATLAGLDELVEDLPELRLASVDRVLGGGFDVLLVIVRAPTVSNRPLAGAIPVVDADTESAAAAAALDAVNRIVGR